MNQKHLTYGLSISALLIGCLGGAVYFVRFVERARHSTREASCQGNMQMINNAISMFERQFGKLPPYVELSDGRRGVSWRVLLCRTLEPDLYERFRVDEPWDSSHNIAAAQVNMPGRYECGTFGREFGRTTRTNYFGVYDSNGKWSNIRQTYATFRFIELPGPGVLWSCPDDDFALLSHNIVSQSERMHPRMTGLTTKGEMRMFDYDEYFEEITKSNPK